jgi:hypothetical protein
MNPVPVILAFTGILYALVSLSPVSAWLPRELVYHSPCSQVRTYRLGEIDSRFGLSEAEVRDLLGQAAAVWNRALGRELIVYHENGEISVSMQYDLRQKLGEEARRLEEILTSKRSQLENREDKFTARIEAYEKRASAYREEVVIINSRGGATPEEFQRLSAEQAYLEQEAAAINQALAYFNQSTREYNAGVGEYGTKINSFNREIGMRPEEGIFDPNNNTITLYLFTSQAELLHTMAHEFGHVLSIDHVSDPEAVMYTYSNENIQLSEKDLEQLDSACQDRKYLLIFWEKLRLGWQNLTESLPVIFSNLKINLSCVCPQVA